MAATDVLTTLARELYDAGLEVRSVAPLSERHPQLTPDDAYVIQAEWARLRTDAGARRLGRKIGATSIAIQTLFAIDTPDYGLLFDDMLVPCRTAIRRDSLILPMVELELAFVLGSSLRGPGVTRDDALVAVDTVIPCIEIIDSRIDAWRIRFVDTVADNGSSALFVLGEPVPYTGQDLAAVSGTLSKNGRAAWTARGSAVLGHPAEAVAWLANLLGMFGEELPAGEVVLSGAFTTADRAEAGDTYEAVFSGLGSVGCCFA